MGTFQQARGKMAQVVRDALAAANVHDCIWDNVQDTPPGDTYAVVSIGFPQTALPTIGCEGTEHLLGTCNVLIYTPRGDGMRFAEEAAQSVIRSWVELNRVHADAGETRLKVGSIVGPNPLAPDQRPLQVVQLSCRFSARTL